MRIFVSVEISDKSVLESIKKVQDSFQIKVKAVELQNIHFTLQFLGEVNIEMVEKIKMVLSKIIFSPFELQLFGIGAFPNPKNPRVIWIGTKTKGGDMLKVLAKKIEDSLLPLGFKQNKTFKPHLTIFRIKNKIDNIIKDLEKFKDYEFGKITISTIKLKQSKLTSAGPIYSDLEVINSN